MSDQKSEKFRKILKNVIESHKKDTIQKIVERDVRVNHKGMSPQEGMKILNDWAKKGVPIIRFLNTLFIVKDNGDKTAKFHTLSSDRKDAFLVACYMFYEFMRKKDYSELTTTFTNEKVIDSLLKWPDNKMQDWESVNKTEDGFELKVDLYGLGK